MLLELMAMTGGHLLFRHLGERRLPPLLKVPECRFEGRVPGGTQVYVETRRVAHARIMFVCVSVPGIDLLAARGVGV